MKSFMNALAHRHAQERQIFSNETHQYAGGAISSVSTSISVQAVRPSPSACEESNSDSCVLCVPALLALTERVDGGSDAGERPSVSAGSGDASGPTPGPPVPQAGQEAPAAARPSPQSSSLLLHAPASHAEPVIQSNSSSSMAEGVPQCRICFEGVTTGPLIRPRRCSGTVAYVHLPCLSSWVKQRGSLDCELCGCQYKQAYVQALQLLMASNTAPRQPCPAPVSAVLPQQAGRPNHSHPYGEVLAGM